jgi:2-methylcitrate dehydratase
MKRETMIEQLSAFVARASYEDLSAEAQREIKVRVLDWLACAIGAIRYKTMRMLRNQIEEFGGRPLVTMIGGGKTSPDRAALYNGALTRYLGFNDSHLSGNRSCHPSESIPAVLAASEYAGASGREFLTALAVAYQVQCRFCEVAHVEGGGLGYNAPEYYAIAAGVAKALNLNKEQTANVIATAGAANKLPQTSHVSASSRCRALPHPDSIFSIAQAVLLEMSSVTDSGEAFEADEHLLEPAVLGYEIDWVNEDLEAVRRTAIKRYTADIHAQSALEAILYLRERRPCHPDQIQRIELDTFDVAYDLLVSRGEGDGNQVRTMAEAYRSLPYLMAVALLDGEVSPSQYKPERILREDVRSLMRKVMIRPDRDFSRRFPDEMPARVQIFLRDGQILTKEKRDYEGYFTRPFGWERAVEKFKDLTIFETGYELSQRIIEKVLYIEDIGVRELTELLASRGQTTKEKAKEKVYTSRRYKLAA